MRRRRFVSLDRVDRFVAAGQDGSPLPMERCRRVRPGAYGRFSVPQAGPSYRFSRPFDSAGSGGSSLSAAVSEHDTLEARIRAFINALRPTLSAKNVKLLEGVFLDHLTLDPIAEAEGRSKQTVSERFGRLRLKYRVLETWWKLYDDNRPKSGSKDDEVL